MCIICFVYILHLCGTHSTIFHVLNLHAIYCSWQQCNIMNITTCFIRSSCKHIRCFLLFQPCPLCPLHSARRYRHHLNCLASHWPIHRIPSSDWPPSTNQTPTHLLGLFPRSKRIICHPSTSLCLQREKKDGPLRSVAGSFGRRGRVCHGAGYRAYARQL